MEEDIKQTDPSDNFVPTRKSHFLQNFLIFILVVFLLSAFAVFVMYAKISKQRTIVRDEIKLLTASEVREYRNRLPTDTIAYVLPEIEFDEGQQTEVQTIRLTDSSQNGSQGLGSAPQSINGTPAAPLPGSATNTVGTTPTRDTSDGVSRQTISNVATAPVPLPDKYRTPQVTPSFNATLVAPDEGSEKVSVEAQCVVFHAYVSQGYFLCTDRTRGRDISVIVDNTTEVLLLGKRTSLSSLLSGDIVYVKGETYEGSSMIHASTVSVTAREEFVLVP